jgi:transcription termination factor NusB
MFGPSINDIKDAMREVFGIGEGSVKKIQELKAEARQAREDLEELRFQKSMEEKEIAHLVKMKEEKIHIESTQKELEMQKKFQAKEMELQKEYFDKVMSTVKEGHKKMEDIYHKILERLPNVNMEITRESK